MANDTEEYDAEQEYQLYFQEEEIYYEVCLQAFINSSFERNKQLLIISYLTIGLLFIFIGKLTNELYVALWFATELIFVTNIIILLHIISLNHEYFKKILDIENNKAEIADHENKIKKYSNFAMILFCFGVLCAIMFTMVMALGYNWSLIK